ncbi:MarR family winged helix-turn-helix transcriptional regulator [Govanella unica]|uniref:MarR family transcriptional regulator n=1 Tax=Govanella unica TaxID=2975056 RepID=A0A9X3Z7I1_9PROT|nr:MarR family transcriptional regulator [Govania unica]MDA5193999.1 MarR family transcriptional regulator [Govania unica]
MASALDIIEEKVKAVPESKQSLRLWLRLLTCSSMIEERMRHMLKTKFDTTLPRFDLMAALFRADGAGVTMGELSRWLMVSNGNVTGVAERLEKEGLILRTPSPTDRRTQIVTLTPVGRAAFELWAVEHENWITGLLGDLDAEDMDLLMGLLAKAKSSVVRHDEEQD